ncbi:MAG TPA: hypothetical protein PLY05_10335, partial [Agitococcus sp.]|nr:hypothetical protein [Agitococcus sp.]
LKIWSAQAQEDVYWRQVLPETEREQLPSEFIEQALELYQPIFNHSKALNWRTLAQDMDAIECSRIVNN